LPIADDTVAGLHPDDRRRLAWWVMLAFCSLGIAVVTGLLGTFEYFRDLAWVRTLGFTLQHLRPLHTTFATCWVFLGGVAVVHAFCAAARPGERVMGRWTDRLQWWCWLLAGLGMLLSLGHGVFSGREYMGFHPALSVPVLVGWGCLAWHYHRTVGFRFRDQPVYRWMWQVGLLYFIFTFCEAHLWLFDGIGERPVRAMALQWKAYGALVGSFNLMVYGSVMWVSERISGNTRYARSNLAFSLFFVGVLNSFTNYGHHTYHLPQNEMVKWVSFLVSMAEIVILAKVLWDCWKLVGGWHHHPRFRITNAFFAATTVWTGLQLLVSLLISVPPINTLFHGTHVITAHAMGSMLGIDSMGLWGACAFVLVAAGARSARAQGSRGLLLGFCWLNLALLPFWGGLLISGIAQGIGRYMGASSPTTYFHRFPWLFAWSGGASVVGVLWLLALWIRAGWAPALGRKTPTC
jgi:nitric oxide reductase subunit B